MLLKNRAVTIVAVITLALGLGANTAIFSTMNSLMLRPLPVRNAERLTVIAPKLQGDDGFNRFSYLDFRDLRVQAEALSDVLAYNLTILGLDTAGRAEPVVATEESGNFFQPLDLHPAAGPPITAHPTKGPAPEPL